MGFSLQCRGGREGGWREDRQQRAFKRMCYEIDLHFSGLTKDLDWFLHFCSTTPSMYVDILPVTVSTEG